MAESFLMSYGAVSILYNHTTIQPRAVSSPCVAFQPAVGQTDGSMLEATRGGGIQRTFLSAL